MTEQLAAQLMPILVTFAVAAASAMAAAALRSLKTKLDSDYANGVLERIERLAFPAVAEQWQLTVADLKQHAEDGKLTQAEAKSVLKAATARVRAGLGRSGVKTAEKIFGADELEVIIRSKLEAAVVEFAKEYP